MINKQYIQYFMTGIFYETVSGVHTPCEVKNAYVNLIAATNNQGIITAVTGKRLLVLGGTLVSAGAAGTVIFKSATGGTNLIAYGVPAAPGQLELPIPPWGVCNTLTAQGLFADNQSAAVVTASVRYVEYTPS